MNTSQSSHDPAGLFLNKSTTLIPQKSPIIRPPAVDTHKSQNKRKNHKKRKITIFKKIREHNVAIKELKDELVKLYKEDHRTLNCKHSINTVCYACSD